VKIFTKLATRVLRRTGDPRILSYAGNSDPVKRLPGLSSWVPDWISSEVCKLTELDSLDEKRINRLSPDGWLPEFSVHQDAKSMKSNLELGGAPIWLITALDNKLLSYRGQTSEEIRNMWLDTWQERVGTLVHTCIPYEEKSQRFKQFMLEFAKPLDLPHPEIRYVPPLQKFMGFFDDIMRVRLTGSIYLVLEGINFSLAFNGSERAFIFRRVRNASTEAP
jgi:hypothetical protein